MSKPLYREVCACPDCDWDGTNPLPEGSIPTQIGWMVKVEPDKAIERMAQRAWDDEGGPEAGTWDDLPEWGKGRYRELARSMWDELGRLDDE